MSCTTTNSAQTLISRGIKLILTRAITCCAITTFYVTLSSADAAEKTLTYVHPEPPVLTQFDKTGKPYDPILKKVGAMLKKAGLQWNDAPVPVYRMYSYLETKPEYFSILIKTPYIEECCITSKHPVFHLELGVYRKPETAPIKTLKELTNKSIITLEEYNYGTVRPFLSGKENNLIIYPAKTHHSAYSMLKADRAPYLLNYRGLADKIQQETEQYGIQYDVLEKLKLYLIFNKDYPDVENLINKLEEISKELGSNF